MRFKLNNFNPIVISYNFYFSLFYLLFPIVISYNLYYTMKKLWYDTPTYTYTYIFSSRIYANKIMNRFIMKNARPPTKKSAQTNTRTTAKNGAAKNRATQLERTNLHRRNMQS